MNAGSDFRVRTVDLDHEQLMVLDGRPGTRVQVLFGGLWLTEEDCLHDRVAQAGEALTLTRRGRAVLEGIGRARLKLIEPVRRWLPTLPQWARELPMRGVAIVLSLTLALGLPELISRGFAANDLAAAWAVAAPRLA
jgi:hypothetical protein